MGLRKEEGKKERGELREEKARSVETERGTHQRAAGRERRSVEELLKAGDWDD